MLAIKNSVLTCIKKVFFTVFIAVSSLSACADESYSAYLFAHFTGESATGEQIYFSTSTDGLHWDDVNYSQPVLTSSIGEKGVRDPAIIRSVDGGKFWLIATDLRIASGKGWGVAQHSGSTNLVVWESPDLVHWSEPWLVDVAGSIPNAGNAWAPEAIYDDSIDRYVVYWATISPLNGIDKGRIYYSTTEDFVQFSTPQMYIDRPGNQEIIDTQIIRVENSRYQYYRASRDGQITFEGSDSILGAWSRIGDLSGIGLTGSDVEGPIMYQFNGDRKWGVMVDQYATGRGYLPLVTSDFSNPSHFKVLSTSEYSLGDSHKRHGGIMGITSEELDAVKSMTVGEPTSRIQSYASQERYLRHYAHKARLDPAGEPAADFRWRVVPGLADTQGYVSFESLNYPGYYLRHYARELVLDENDQSRVFAEDATFKRVDGLADSLWSSFQSYNYPDRYIVVSGDAVRVDQLTNTSDDFNATFEVITPQDPLAEPIDEPEPADEPEDVSDGNQTDPEGNEEIKAGLFYWVYLLGLLFFLRRKNSAVRHVQ